MRVPTAAVLAAAGVLVLLLILLFWAMRSRRNTGRRLMVVTARLADESQELVGRGRLDRRTTALERMAEQAVTELGAARLARQRLEGALKAVPPGVVVCDEDGEIVFQNEAAAAVDLTRGQAWEAMTEALRSSVGGEPQRRTIEVYGPPRRSLAVQAVPLDDGWRTTGAVIVVDDLSSQRRIEAVRRDFVANVTHELRRPIAGLALLAEAVAAEEDARVAERLAARLEAEATRVAKLVNDLLELSGVEAEEAPTRDPVQAHTLVAEAVSQVHSLALRRSVNVAVGEVPAHVTVLGDRRRLASALANLLDNAVRYSDAGSQVVVECGADGSWVDLHVHDQGMGIPEVEQERIFERFYRVDPARRRDAEGSGLGLAIVRHVAGGHGGEVRVDSEPGRGSTFTLRLPGGPGPVAVRRAEAG